MSVPARLRNVKDTESTSKSDVIDSCKRLYMHAVLLCKSRRVQDSYFTDLADCIVDESLAIYLDCFRANTIPFYRGKITEQNYKDRTELIIEAMRMCSDLQGLVTLGKTAFKWRNRQIEYWVGIVLETRERMSHWYSWCIREYNGQES